MYDSSLGHAVRTSLESIAAGSGTINDSERDAFRRRICAAVDELKSLGWPIERIIVRMKEVADEAGIQAYAKDQERGGAAIKADIVRMCIDRYFHR